jgi:hypothetical protein
MLVKHGDARRECVEYDGTERASSEYDLKYVGIAQPISMSKIMLI